jgi:rubrerythrin
MMPLTNFGAILNFAETLEKDDRQFYRQACEHPAAGTCGELLADLAAEGKKSIALVQRTRRENVTEMILEPIQDFKRDSYQVTVNNLADMEQASALLEAADLLERRALGYYTDAAEKIRALPEVARALKSLAKKRSKRIARIERLIA